MILKEPVTPVLPPVVPPVPPVVPPVPHVVPPVPHVVPHVPPIVPPERADQLLQFCNVHRLEKLELFVHGLHFLSDLENYNKVLFTPQQRIDQTFCRKKNM